MTKPDYGWAVIIRKFPKDWFFDTDEHEIVGKIYKIDHRSIAGNYVCNFTNKLGTNYIFPMPNDCIKIFPNQEEAELFGQRYINLT